ncbi:MAG TPA: potassium/proton antiporter [Roseiflexaceae bacterium]|nr:potassium/proton antiporter [Roseiflexaceae bacterium]HMP41016.1 potassium/proton antiporter [Roseiflexaceae bacterium]
MALSLELTLLIGALLLILSIIASKASLRLGVPALLFFIAIGMLAGSEGPGGIPFSDAGAAQSLGVIALAFILFSGGLDSDWRTFRPVLGKGMALANVGVIISTLLVGAFATMVLGFSPIEGMLLGAIISSTDAAAVFGVMRTREVALRDNLEPLIELESGSNDPMAVFLTIGLTGILMNPARSLFDLVPMFVLQMSIGGLAGYAMGRLMTVAINRVRLSLEGLYPALTIGMMLLTYSGADLLGGNGFLAVYIAGVVFGNSDFIHKRSLLRFHDGVAWLMQITMFLALGLLVFPSRLLPVAGDGLLVAIFLIFVARPLSVLIALAFSKLDLAAKLMVAWAGLRGAVPIILATFPLLAGVPRADMIFNLVFFSVLASVLIQGTTIAYMARLLRVNTIAGHDFHYPQEFVPQVTLSSRLAELTITPDAPAAGRAVVEIGLPKGALVVLVTRDGEGIVPQGSTVLQAGDRVLLLGERADLDTVWNLFRTTRRNN